MKRLLTIIPVVSDAPIVTKTIEVLDDADGAPLKTLQEAVGGLIEIVPHFFNYEDKKCIAFCNEEGQRLNLTPNRRATQLWLNQLGDGPFRYEPMLLGNVVIDQAAP